MNLEKLIEKFSSGGNKPEKSIGVSVEEAMSLRRHSVVEAMSLR